MIDLPMYDADSWQLKGTCARMNVDPNVMQPERATREEVAEAIELCNGCPVADMCHDHADSQRTVEGHPAAYGVHAGIWWGPDPVWEVEAECGVCGSWMRAGEGARYCSARCRKAASRRRAA